jgi:hypothetical protein
MTTSRAVFAVAQVHVFQSTQSAEPLATAPLPLEALAELPRAQQQIDESRDGT